MGPIKAAAALACLLGLAACGGGGGGSVAGGDPTPPEPFFLENDAARVATLNTAIATPVAPRQNDEVTLSRAVDGFSYDPETVGDDTPRIDIVQTSPVSVVGSLDSNRLDGDVWLFTDEYESGGVNYRALVVMSYDTALTLATDSHTWGVWMRQNTDTGDWDSVNPFNFRARPNHEAAYDIGQFSGFEGSYSFTGGANGIYTKDDATAGWFSADTRLTVNYGGSDVPSADRFTMTGTIDNFVLSGLEKVDWTVTLSGAPPKSGGTPTDVYLSGTATGEGGAQDGTFRADINYPRRETTGTPLLPPIWVFGIFDAYFSDGVAVGAFNGSREN